MIDIKERIIKEAEYIIETKKTIRKTAEEFKLSKSTIHNDLKNRLQYINQDLYKEIKDIMQVHNDNKHYHGGQSTKEKYEKIRRDKDEKK